MNQIMQDFIQRADQSASWLLTQKCNAYPISRLRAKPYEVELGPLQSTIDRQRRVSLLDANSFETAILMISEFGLFLFGEESSVYR